MSGVILFKVLSKWFSDLVNSLISFWALHRHQHDGKMNGGVLRSELMLMQHHPILWLLDGQTYRSTNGPDSPYRDAMTHLAAKLSLEIIQPSSAHPSTLLLCLPLYSKIRDSHLNLPQERSIKGYFLSISLSKKSIKIKRSIKVNRVY